MKPTMSSPDCHNNSFVLQQLLCHVTLTRRQISPLQLMNLIASTKDEEDEGASKKKRSNKATHIQVCSCGVSVVVMIVAGGDDDDCGSADPSLWWKIVAHLNAACSAVCASPCPSPPFPPVSAAECCGLARSERDGLKRGRQQQRVLLVCMRALCSKKTYL